MNRIILLSIFLFLIGQPLSYACSCIYIPTFCETINYSDSIYHDLIVLGTVTGFSEDGMDIYVKERLFGQDQRQKIFIKNGNGADCGEHTSQFKRGQNLILALHKAYNPNGEDDRYWLSICGINFLKVDNGNVIGPIAPGIVLQSYEDFKKATTCSVFQEFNPESVFEPEFKLYPNPANNKIYIDLEESYSEFQFDLIDLQGRIIYKGIRRELEGDSQVQIDLPSGQLSNGLYFFRINNEFGRKTVKLLINNF